ncbi:MAG: hypothetical protein GT600_13360 [Bacteroidales bacterium]|jgi:hypothetical protein|nr:hypothetical protein [Bacteroidales bacterium]HOU03378.1 hypothetical protein [Bacteroidales bacterium]HQK69273.1 hypothetical protein [Bacteroidales bacterium]
MKSWTGVKQKDTIAIEIYLWECDDGANPDDYIGTGNYEIPVADIVTNLDEQGIQERPGIIATSTEGIVNATFRFTPVMRRIK